MTRLVVPGPEVTRAQPGTPVSRPTAAAMNAAFCSWRHTTSWGPPSTRASYSSSIFAPGTPKT
nr:hypothetical protein [Herbidospora solisilvae]